ncbi:hypothetical protein TH63_17230 [Rufibacter radiotolerans]|uniref:Uncharacterized protein n=1 Tax=Rufibacter radiotolerans TaxID=1379910 RepID=A0A0H4WBA2_9BACT|nr:hypothetical protein TH63_17230 [Rufibacter radiotolerans]
MEKLRKIKLELYNLKTKARKIFRRGYEDLTMLIYYHDLKENFKLLIVNTNQTLLLEKEISRAEAFRIMNTRR